jgi:hypothetical protein
MRASACSMQVPSDSPFTNGVENMLDLSNNSPMSYR